MGNLTRITKFKHFSGLTITASNSLPNSTANRYQQGEERHSDNDSREKWFENEKRKDNERKKI